MVLYSTLGVFAAYMALSLVLLPMQYRYIVQLKESHKKSMENGLPVDEYYESKSFQTQLLHLNAQGNILFIGANVMASLLYKWKHRKN